MPSPNTIYVSGPMTKNEDYPCGPTVIKPGMVIEPYDVSGVKKWRPHSSATGIRSRFVALEKLGKGLDINYAEDDLVLAGLFGDGSKFLGLLPSGQNISYAEYLQSNGDGLLKSATSSTAGDNVAAYQSEDAPGAVTVETRILVRVVG